MDRKKFSHVHQLQVRNYEVDWQGVVHNGNYLLYCEVGRIEYLKHIGARVDLTAINSKSRIVIVRNEIDYRSPARFGELLTVRTRVAWIRSSSFAMEGLIEHAATGEVVAENIAIHVWLDPVMDRSVPVPDEFRELVRAFEGANCEFLHHSTPE